MGVIAEEGPKYPKPNKLFGVRHVQVVLLFLALVVIFGMRVNLGLALVAMTDSSNENIWRNFSFVLGALITINITLCIMGDILEASCTLILNHNTYCVGPSNQSFDWSVQTQSVMLSSFFWGYVVFQIPGGELAARVGGKILILLSVAINSVVTLLIPTAAYYGGWMAVCGCRIVQGLSQGPMYPSLYILNSKWIPLEEKARLSTVIYAGAQLGTAFQLMISGFIAGYLGWEAIFYVQGSIGVVLGLTYFILGSDSPASSKIIGHEEKMYIQNSLGHVGVQKKLNTPWSTIATSLPFYALLIAHCGQNWGLWTLLTEMPLYMASVLGVDIKSNGVMSALPYLAMYLMSFPFAFLSDYALEKKWVGVNAARKISNTIGLMGPGLVMIGLVFAPEGNIAAALGCFIVIVALNAGHYTGFTLVHIDMAPNFAGTLVGITNCIANIIALIAPLVAGVLLKDETSADDWNKVFYLTSAIYIVSNTFFVIFGDGKRQKWNEPADTVAATDTESGAVYSDQKEIKAN